MEQRERISRVQDVAGLLHGHFPPALAENWDNVGLHVGDPAAIVSRVVVCLDPSEEALRFALESGAQAMISHHPLIFSPLKSLVPTTETGKVLMEAVRSGVAILCAHTNLDRAKDGLNDWLADELGLSETVPLDQPSGDLLKLVVFVPCGHEEAVAEALFSAGAGHVGGYDRCSFSLKGEGSFRPGQGTKPFIGEVGKDEKVVEIRLETILPAERLDRVVAKLLKVHPYQEPAYDIFPLANRRAGIGLGRIGTMSEEMTLTTFADHVKERLKISALRVVGEGDVRIRKVALCGGGGASLLAEAFRRGADVFVTGDIKYHEAQKAQSLGIALIDAGHFATERVMVSRLVRLLGGDARMRGMKLEFLEMKGEEDPFKVI